ncbi:PHP domain-containing protein [Desulfitobacterium metallireducens]|uniref:Histidinol phosphatase n=1 Tax=Desulfitobacterium metallireducens DSM 15288 TaxID=871968 RepID=W0EC84_9FIRM|nr:PHP domain-containing protein [Desulfitobacterium metallireducens]AHF06656.1 histidinol phosphatase [Desulfitobacterium metallireducens DSM 15288]
MRVQSSRFPEADLHCHTTSSDGLFTPRELIQAASELGLKAVGITDHDTISGWSEAFNAGEKYGVEILRGVELNTEWKGIEVHILGYEPSPESGQFQAKLQELREDRSERIYKIIGRLHDLKIEITEEEIKTVAHGESVGRPHVAQVLIQRGYVKTIKEAFDSYIGKGSPAYVPRLKLTPEEGIKLIRTAGGVAVLAHPGIHQLGNIITPWIKAGLQGIEVSHSEHTPEDERRCRALAKQYHLITTGGSDFHGEERKPGVKLGEWGTSYEVVEQIRELAESSKRKNIS